MKGHVFVAADALRAFILAAAVFALTSHGNPDLEIDVIDVGQGDGIVISCEGKHMLIDGGSTSKKNVGKYQIIPVLKYKGIGSLDAVVMTHEDEDHISGILGIMDDMEKGGIRIKQLILPEVSERSRGDNYHLLETRARDLGTPVAYINTGESFSLGRAFFTCLNPDLNMATEGANAYSTVLYMEYKGAEKTGSYSGEAFTALFTGDMEGEGLTNVKQELREAHSGMQAREGLDCTSSCINLPEQLTLLKVAHHGSQYTTDAEFLELTRPKVAIISCGRDNSYGHPHQELLDRLDATGTQVYRTDKGGEISVIYDDNSTRISLFSGQN